MKQPDLYALLQKDPQAKAYFDDLPGYVRAHMESRPQGINSLSSLQDYAENLLRGDG